MNKPTLNLQQRLNARASAISSTVTLGFMRNSGNSGSNGGNNSNNNGNHNGNNHNKIRRQARRNSRLAWDSRVTAPTIKLDLTIECKRLPKKDSFSQADALCGIWEVPIGYNNNNNNNNNNNGNSNNSNSAQQSNNGNGSSSNSNSINVTKVGRLATKQEKLIGQTEVVRASKNPQFRSTFRLEYKFQAEQTYVIRVYNEDLKLSTDFNEHDYIGGCVFTLGELMGGAGCSIARSLGRGCKAFVVLTGMEIVETREVLEFRFSGQNLGLLEKKKNKSAVQVVAKDALETLQKVNVAKTVLDKFDAYFRLEKLNEDDQSWIVVWKSEVVSDNQNPTWNGARIPLQLLCDDEPKKALKITIWVYNRFTHDDLVGFFETSVDELVNKARRGIPVFDVMHERKKLFGAGTKLKKAGTLKVLKSNVVCIPSMLEYIAGDCELDLMFAVDCSVSNVSDWRNENSLHYHSSTWLNDYQAVIHRIGTIFDDYESRRVYTMWGYGGTIKNGQQLQQATFSIGENIVNADELVKAYDQTFAEDNYDLTLGKSAANITQVIQAAMYRSIRSNQTKQCYSTLVILTAGGIADLQGTIDAVCAAAEDAPLSIVIVGIGEGDFESIQALTSGNNNNNNDRLTHSNGVSVARDILQFVHMNDFHGNARECVSEALREIPEQFVQYFINAGIRPNPPKAVPDFSRDHANKRAAPRQSTTSTTTTITTSTQGKSRNNSRH